MCIEVKMILFFYAFSSATMTSGDEEDCLACSFKTVIHRPTIPKTAPPPAQPPSPPPPHFYLAPTDHPSQTAVQSDVIPEQSSPLIPIPPVPLPVLVLPSPPLNLPIHQRAHTDTDLLFYNQQSFVYPVHWYPPTAAAVFMYPNQRAPPANFVYADGPPLPPLPPRPLPSFAIHPIPQQQVRSSSADCRRTANNGNEHRVIHPERVW